MSRTQRRKLFCVWDNMNGDAVVAIDQTSDVCAALMGIARASFFTLKSRMNSKTDVQRRWTIIDSKEIIESED
jgi:hypothetical protein